MDRYLSVEEVAALLPPEKGRPVHSLTVCRYITEGCYGVKLRAYRPGRRYFIHPEAVEEFLAASTAARDTHAKAPTTHAKRDPARKRKAKKALARHGIK